MFVQVTVVPLETVIGFGLKAPVVSVCAPATIETFAVVGVGDGVGEGVGVGVGVGVGAGDGAGVGEGDDVVGRVGEGGVGVVLSPQPAITIDSMAAPISRMYINSDPFRLASSQSSCLIRRDSGP